MRFCKNHPCFGWLPLEAQDYRFVYNKLIEMRDHLEELAKQPVYKKRISDHLDQMNLVIANRERELQNTYLVQELDKLKDRKQLIESFI